MDIKEFIHQMPKVELHRHLSGAVRSASMFRIASNLGVELEGGDLEQFKSSTSMYGEEKGFHIFLSKFKSRAQFYTDMSLINEVTRSVVHDAAEENIIYLELRFSASHFSRHMKFDFEDVTEQIISTALEEAGKSGMEISFLMTLTRELPLEENSRLTDVALSSRFQKYFVGIDVAGDEANVPLEKLVPLLSRVLKQRKKLTIHAGEAGPAQNVKKAIEKGASRIGHGVRSFADSKILSLAQDKNITYEVCPTSNLQTVTIKEVKELNLKSLLDRGVCITINTDDPGISETTLTNEFLIVQDVFSLTAEEIKTLSLNAVNNAFTSEEKKDVLREKIRNSSP